MIEGADGWFLFDPGEYVDLGELDSVSIWCERFSVSFGAAAVA